VVLKFRSSIPAENLGIHRTRPPYWREYRIRAGFAGASCGESD
jgi:hypothetical protein